MCITGKFFQSHITTELVLKQLNPDENFIPVVVCGFHAACTNCILPGVQVTTGLDLVPLGEYCDSLFYRPSLPCKFIVG